MIVCDPVLSHLVPSSARGGWFVAGAVGKTWSWGDALGMLQISRGCLRLQGHVKGKTARVAPSGCWPGRGLAAICGAGAGAGSGH